MAEWFDELTRSFRPADAIDIALVAMFLYAVLSWFKETASRSVLVGVFLLALVYFMARAFDMYMTVLLFQAVFAVLLVTLVVVFQEDLRRAFERLGTWGKIGERRPFPDDFSYFETLSETAAALAARHVGALLVLRGKDPLQRHLSGGVRLDGKLSRPLLESIFDPHSTGHDGAVIIEDGRITQFAAHLPLSRSHHELSGRGTRHTAAVGLSERCDALVIVVSEERGRISVAEQGKLRQMASGVDLEERLEKFWRRNFPQADGTVRHRWLRRNSALKAGAVGLACLAWFFISHRAVTVQQSFNLPVEFRNVPDRLVVASSEPATVNVILTGQEREFYLLQPSTLKVSFDLKNIEEGPQYLTIDDHNVARPFQLDVYRVEPRNVTLIVHRMKPVMLQVDVPLVGQLPEPLRLSGVKVEPARVQAMSWLAEPGQNNKIQVEPVDLTQITKSTSFKTRLVVPDHVRFPGNLSPEVRVSIELTKAAAAGATASTAAN